MTTTDVNDLVQDISGLVTLPDVYLRINRLVEDPNSSIDNIAKAVSQDPSFTVRLLRVANSPFYHASSTIATVSKAIAIIGTAQIRSLALSMSVASSFAGLSNDLVSMENFWRHSLLCALAARHLAKEAGRCDPEALFTAGLLHDIGELVIFNRKVEQAREALINVLDSQDELPIYEAENQAMGFNHAEVGGALARRWQLPPLLVEGIAYHHSIGDAIQYPRQTALVHLANIIALMAELDTTDLNNVSPIDPRAWEVTGLTSEVLAPIINEIQAEIEETESLFLQGTPEK